MAIFDYTKKMDPDYFKTKAKVKSVELQSEPVKESEQAISPVVQAVPVEPQIVSPTVDTAPFTGFSAVFLRKVPNASIQIDGQYSSNVRLVQIPDQQSFNGYGILMVDKSCIEASVGTDRRFVAGFSDVLISEDGSSMMGHYFRFNQASGQKPIATDIAPTQLEQMWSDHLQNQFAAIRQSSQTIEMTGQEEDMQYGNQ